MEKAKEQRKLVPVLDPKKEFLMETPIGEPQTPRKPAWLDRVTVREAERCGRRIGEDSDERTLL